MLEKFKYPYLSIDHLKMGLIRSGRTPLTPLDGTILPERDIDQSLNAPGAIAYKAVVDGRMVGGAVVVIDGEKKHGDLHLLYVKCGCQNCGVGKAGGKADATIGLRIACR